MWWEFLKDILNDHLKHGQTLKDPTAVAVMDLSPKSKSENELKLRPL